jgi:hypothetical protein
MGILEDQTGHGMIGCQVEVSKGRDDGGGGVVGRHGMEAL